MKTKVSLIAFVLFLLLQFPCSLFAGSPAPSFNDSVTLKLEFDEYKGGRRWENSNLGALHRGDRMVAVRVRVLNISESKQEVALDEICLYDTVNKRKYEPEFVMKENGFKPDSKKYQTVKKGDYIFRKIVYSVPMNVVTSLVLYNNKLWPINK